MTDDGLRNAFTHPENLAPRIASLSGPEHVTGPDEGLDVVELMAEVRRLRAENQHYRELLRAMREAA